MDIQQQSSNQTSTNNMPVKLEPTIKSEPVDTVIKTEPGIKTEPMDAISSIKKELKQEPGTIKSEELDVKPPISSNRYAIFISHQGETIKSKSIIIILAFTCTLIEVFIHARFVLVIRQCLLQPVQPLLCPLPPQLLNLPWEQTKLDLRKKN